MEKHVFQERLVIASKKAMTFAREVVNNSLNERFVFVLLLNDSYHDENDEDQDIYPEDSDRVLICNELEEVTETLVRNGKCPQWVNVSVAGANRHETLIQLRCCCRYQADEQTMARTAEGSQPFFISSPPLRSWLKPGGKYRLPSVKRAIWAIENKKEPLTLLDRFRKNLWYFRSRFEDESSKRGLGDSKPEPTFDPTFFTDDLSISLPGELTYAELVDFSMGQLLAHESVEPIQQELVRRFHLSEEDASLALDRIPGGIIRALTGRVQNRPDRSKDPMAYIAFDRTWKTFPRAHLFSSSRIPSGPWKAWYESQR